MKGTTAKSQTTHGTLLNYKCINYESVFIQSDISQYHSKFKDPFHYFLSMMLLFESYMLFENLFKVSIRSFKNLYCRSRPTKLLLSLSLICASNKQEFLTLKQHILSHS